MNINELVTFELKKNDPNINLNDDSQGQHQESLFFSTDFDDIISVVPLVSPCGSSFRIFTPLILRGQRCCWASCG